MEQKELNDNEFASFVLNHANDDTKSLRLKYHGRQSYIAAIEQIELRRKAREKFKDRDGNICLPNRLFSGVSVEQASSYNIAAFHCSLANGAHKILDMTMGMGSDAVAFASIPQTEVTAIELNNQLAVLSADNYKHLNNLTVINDDSVQWLKNSHKQFDLIFIDPARRDENGSRVINLHDCTPDITTIIPELFEHAPRVLVKLSPMLDITATINELSGVAGVYVIEERGDCRELLLDLRRDFNEEPQLYSIRDGINIFSCKRSEEIEAVASFARPTVGQYLYEPYVSIMKLSPFKLLCERYSVNEASPNSHVYFGESLISDFPGRTYRITDVLPYSSSVIKRLARTYPKASVAVRNFPLTADALRARLRIKDSDQLRIIATTLSDLSKILIINTPLELK